MSLSDQRFQLCNEEEDEKSRENRAQESSLHEFCDLPKLSNNLLKALVEEKLLLQIIYQQRFRWPLYQMHVKLVKSMRALVPHKLLFAVIRGEHLRLMALFHKYRAVFGIEDLI